MRVGSRIIIRTCGPRLLLPVAWVGMIGGQCRVGPHGQWQEHGSARMCGRMMFLEVTKNIYEKWLTNQNPDLWSNTSPPGGMGWNDPRAMPRWSAWPMAGAWFCTHLWEHYLFTGDQKFLREKAWPLMKGASQFMLRWLVV